MDTDQSQKVRRYMELKVLEKKTVEEIDALKAEVLGSLLDYNGPEAKVQSGLGKLSIQTRQTWTFPAEIKEMETVIKESKKIAKQSGTATAIDSHNLLFKEASGEQEDGEEPLKV